MKKRFIGLYLLCCALLVGCAAGVCADVSAKSESVPAAESHAVDSNPEKAPGSLSAGGKQEDLLPEKKSKRPLPEMPASKDVGGNTRPLMKAVKIETPAEPEKSEGEETGNRRRRRRSAPTGTAPLRMGATSKKVREKS